MDEVITTLIPSLVEDGSFGPGKLKSISNDNSDVAFQFSSEISLFSINLILQSGETKSLPVFIKIQMSDEAVRKARDTDTMFQNEIAMYTEILPYLNKDKTFSYPKPYYGYATGGKDYNKDVLILENVGPKGYLLSPVKVYFDLDHILIGLKKIAELHAWSYRAKYEDGLAFFSKITKLKTCMTSATDNFDFEEFIYEAMKRGMDPFIEKGIEAELLKRFLETVRPAMRFMDRVISAEEPFGVVIHGDYCKNNMFFKYDSDNKPVDAMYFDLQHSKYGSPVIDLSFFLYLHTSVELRKTHWDDFLQFYWTMVRASVPKEVPLPTFQEFLDHFASRAVFGYVPCSFFLPRMIGGGQPSNEMLHEKPFHVLVDILLNNGGEEGHQSVRNVVAHLLEKKYIHKYMQDYEKN